MAAREVPAGCCAVVDRVRGLLLAAPADAQRTVDDWLAAARAHEPGQLDESAVALSQWPRDATFAAIDRASRDADADIGVLDQRA